MTNAKEVVAFVFVAFLFGLIAGIVIDREYMKAQAVKHNAAEYDQKCGVWRWKEPTSEANRE